MVVGYESHPRSATLPIMFCLLLPRQAEIASASVPKHQTKTHE
jgi:hypothetical protein